MEFIKGRWLRPCFSQMFCFFLSKMLERDIPDRAPNSDVIPAQTVDLPHVLWIERFLLFATLIYGITASEFHHKNIQKIRTIRTTKSSNPLIWSHKKLLSGILGTLSPNLAQFHASSAPFRV